MTKRAISVGQNHEKPRFFGSMRGRILPRARGRFNERREPRPRRSDRDAQLPRDLADDLVHEPERLAVDLEVAPVGDDDADLLAVERALVLGDLLEELVEAELEDVGLLGEK